MMRSVVPPWSPQGFSGYREWYPNTPVLRVDARQDVTHRFIDQWRRGNAEVSSALRRHAHSTTIVFLRGFLGRFMPGNFIRPVKAVKSLGFDARLAPTHTGDLIANNAARLIRHLDRYPPRASLVFCAHSRGGLEALLALVQDTPWRDRCRGVLLSQTARGPSLIMDSLLLKMHRDSNYSPYRRGSEMLQRWSLKLTRASRGGHELTSRVWPGLIQQAEYGFHPFPIIQTASWSIRPTAWLDSFHGRLKEIAPGQAHDGQFLLQDLCWPEMAHVLLPELDHAQPVMDGGGFDAARYWLAYLGMVLT